MPSRVRTAVRSGLLAFGIALVVGAILLGLPWATERRDRVASVPVAPDLEHVALVRLEPGARACTGPAVFGPTTARARFTVRAGRAGSPPIDVLARAPGYRAAARVAGGSPGRRVQTVALSTAPRSVAGTLCLADAGHAPVALEATGSPRRATTRVDGRRVGATVVLTLLERRRSSILARLGSIARHVSAFRPAFVGPAVLALLAAAVVALLVAGLPMALARALAEDARHPDRARAMTTGADPAEVRARGSRRRTRRPRGDA